MRHANKKKRIGRSASHRKATLQALSTALIRHKRIETTLAKARALRPFVEPILNRAKDDSTASRRQAFRRLQDKEAVKTLFSDVADAIGDRPGGYTRIVKLGQRAGDAAEMAVIELVDFNDVKPEGSSGPKRKTRRSRRRSGGSQAAPAAAPLQAAPAEEPEAEAPETTEAEATPEPETLDAEALTEEAPAEDAPAAEAPASEATEADDLTKIWGIGPVFAEALTAGGIGTFSALAEADIETLRGIIDTDTKKSADSVNEETWAAQARLAADGDWDGLQAFIDEQKAEGGSSSAPAEGTEA
ncbi:MAG: 50S ribosomal protein L17 [Bacteroidota bacterium]